MRGLIYKDVSIFFRSIDKKLILVALIAIVLLFSNAGGYAGMFASVMLAITIGMQSIMSFASDEKANWKKYQLAMPINETVIVISKYISVLFTIVIGVIGSLILNILSSILFKELELSVWLLSVSATIIIPLLWTGICLPLTYWFGFHSAQTMGLLVVIPIFYFVKYFEDGAGISSMFTSIHNYIFITCIIAIWVWCISILISIIGYKQRKYNH